MATLDGWKGSASILASVARRDPDIIIYSDASGDIGFGMIEIKQRLFGMGKWNPSEKKTAMRKTTVSSTYLEILAICKAILSFAPANSHVHVRSDSQTAIFIMEKRYDRNSDIAQGIIVSLDKHCRDNGISVFFTHTPREDEWIRVADLSKNKLSKILYHSWSERQIVDVIPTLF
jgi:ribonuclease HI